MPRQVQRLKNADRFHDVEIDHGTFFVVERAAADGEVVKFPVVLEQLRNLQVEARIGARGMRLAFRPRDTVLGVVGQQGFQARERFRRFAISPPLFVNGEAEPVVQGAGPGACRNALEPLEIGVVHRLPALVAGGDEGEVLIQLVQGSLQLFA